ncbi:hypothetical protein GobsT_14080 [Gemmata obscuriglobus]|uniref:Uncharacterized protein n=1 Tax=Gemmata obscuriglobus TaxID=114 RepID=A0A2Z3HB24_9BACT|nr:hypothetical protein [Gemmata obscuriglobus]AWM40155.1 hypothetical protein C1280_26230 [Gemmata obscuriglobus]QEG26663.1 hypothetical protein GobsT_14080 [Gemmata obscuriglobus]VTS02277.1 Uncharacterized protein OS=Ktedonobacter racemifer DSM 44963 GN=Krac_1266 PE=4 SV=1 [Gemmata obscuriglobus UQM 2246]
MLFGADVAAAWPSPPPARRLAYEMAIAYGYLARLFESWPPGPDEPWLGLVRGPVRLPDGTERPGTRRLVGAVLAVACVLVAQRSGVWVAAKREIGPAYRATVGGRAADVVDVVYNRCRIAWGYAVPTGRAEQLELQQICTGALSFLTSFEATYREFLHSERNAPDAARAHFAAERLTSLAAAPGAVFSGVPPEAGNPPLGQGGREFGQGERE